MYILGLKSYRPYCQGLSSSKTVERELIKEIVKRSCPRLQTAGKQGKKQLEKYEAKIFKFYTHSFQYRVNERALFSFVHVFVGLTKAL